MKYTIEHQQFKVASALAFSVATGAALSGCSGSAGHHDQTLDISGPVATDRGLVFDDNTHDEILVAKPVAGTLEVARLKIGTASDEVAWMVPTVNQDAVLLMNVATDAKQEDVVEQLIHVDSTTLVQTTYDVGAPFNAIKLTENGQYGVLYFSEGLPSTPLQNVNQAAIVDFAEGSVRLITVDGFGGRVRDVVFPKGGMGVDVAGVSRDIAVFVAEGEVVIVDLADPTVNDTQVAFRFDTSSNFLPSRVLIRPGDDLIETPALFFVSESDADVTMLSLVEKLNSSDEVDRFTVQPGLLPVGNGTTDIELHRGDGIAYLLSVRDYGVLFTDIATQGSFFVDFGAPVETGYLRPSEYNGAPSTELVAWSYGGSYLHTLDLSNIESALGRSPKLTKISNRIGDVSVLDVDRVVVESLNNSVQFYVVDFARDFVAPLTWGVAFDLNSATVLNNQLILGVPGYNRLGSIDLDTFDPSEVELDSPLESMHVLPATGRLVAVHESSAYGYLTDVDALDLSRGNATSHLGFFLEGDLDRQEEED
jgi:hypothetical protein